MKSFSEGVEELIKIAELSRQQWLLGAGASVMSGIPLMYPLTKRVRACLAGLDAEIFDRIISDLPIDAHVEHVLSHLGDLIAIAERSKKKTVNLAGKDSALAELEDAYKAVIKTIATTVRHGYCAADATTAEKIGTLSDPLVEVDAHRKFIRQLFRSRANLETRSRVGFVTTNYDTLIEDALAMERRVAIDGFSGGAIAFWDGMAIDPQHKEAARCHRILKLHGSVDWFRDETAGLVRARYGTRYLADLSSTLIYPQATKYVETQKDPFARIFDCFRRSLSSPEDHLLAIVGYSFGDNHINNEIESALSSKGNKTTLVAFSKELPITGGAIGTELCPVLRDWLASPLFGSRVYVATDKGLHNGGDKATPAGGANLNWWTFSGLTKFLEDGVAA